MKWITSRRETGLVEHICECGTGHPAYGSALWIAEAIAADKNEPVQKHLTPWLVHGCCGCCRRDDFPGKPVDSLKKAHEIIRDQHAKLEESADWEETGKTTSGGWPITAITKLHNITPYRDCFEIPEGREKQWLAVVIPSGSVGFAHTKQGAIDMAIAILRAKEELDNGS